MKNFQCLETGIDTIPLLNAVQRSPLWDTETLRTAHKGSSHQSVSDIWLRFNDLKNLSTVIDEHESINYPAFWQIPQARPLIFGVMARLAGERLGRVIITKLRPGKRIDPHVDGGSHAAYYDRYHIVLQGLPGSLFRCGDETVQMLTGECWWFDNSVEHEIVNNSSDDRVHMIIDIRSSR